MHINKIEPCSMVNGDGCRMVLVFQGCSLNCPGCFSKELHDFTAGKVITPERLAIIVSTAYIDSPLLDGITLSGGNPQEQDKFIDFLYYLNQFLPRRTSIWMWSGFTMEEIQKDENLKEHLEYIDVVITGRFEQDKHIEHQYYGSSNQEMWEKKNEIWTKKLNTIAEEEEI